MAIPITKEMREQAKLENKYLVQISIDGRHLKKPDCMMQLSGPMSIADAKELQALITKQWKRRNARKATR